MIKLIDILSEIFLNEKIIKVPQEVLNKNKEVFNYINTHLEDLKSKSEGKKWNDPYIDSKFKDYFKFKDLKDQDIKITIGFYNDPKDAGTGRMDTQKDILLINLNYPITDLEDFEDLIEHELVHAMDPKVRDIRLFGKMYAKKGANPSGSTFTRSLSKTSLGSIKSEFEKSYEKYLKSPWEFDAFTAPLINKLSNNIKKNPSYRDILIQLLSDIKSKSIQDIVSDKKYEKMPYFFSAKEWTTENFSSIYNEYVNELNKIKIWANKPTLYKRFLKRLGTGL